jgi:superoxide dismutase, Fe-Mn family
MIFELPELKFSPEDLGEFMSEDTVFYHYEKHHQAYADKANTAIEGTPYENLDIETIIQDTYKKTDSVAIFNNTAQFYNHSLFWEVMNTTQDKTITPEFETKISNSFGSFQEFKDQFCALAVSQFGSGWCWLVEKEDGSLELYKTANAKSPLVYGQNPLMCCDVWEHAYYLDYKNERLRFVKNFLDHLVNWQVVEKRLKK